MRSSRRLLLQFQTALIAICFVACPHAVAAQTPTQLPPQWDEAVSRLADEIAADVSPMHALSLETKNISDLSASEAGNVQAALETKLKNRSFHFANSDSSVSEPAANVQFTISQSVEGHVLIAELRSGVEPNVQTQIAIVAAPKPVPGIAEQNLGTLTLDKRLIWQQPTKFLDFQLLAVDAAGNPSLLAILEPDRLAYYRAQDGGWRFSQAISISHSPRRDLLGAIDNDGKRAYLGDITCAGELIEPETLECLGTGTPTNSGVTIMGFDTGVSVELGSPCAGLRAYLETGTGDWTQPDSLQSFESKDRQFTASGAPIATEGPVISITQGSAPASARAVVYNLKTKNYEAYIVAATCSH